MERRSPSLEHRALSLGVDNGALELTNCLVNVHARIESTAAAPASTRDAVFDSAPTLFRQGGFDGVSVDDIAAMPPA